MTTRGIEHNATVWPQYKLQFGKESDESELRMEFRIMLVGRQNEKIKDLRISRKTQGWGRTAQF